MRRHLAEAGFDRGCLDDALESMLERPELGWVPSPPDRAELAALVESAL